VTSESGSAAYLNNEEYHHDDESKSNTTHKYSGQNVSFDQRN